MPMIDFWQTLFEHLLLSAIPTAVGVALAWPVSKWVASWLDRDGQGEHTISTWRILFPWRTILVTLLVLFLPFVPVNHILGHGLLFFLTGISLASFAVGLVLLTRAQSVRGDLRHSSAKFVEALRTLAVAIVAVAAPAYDELGLGLGWMIQAGLVRLGLDVMWIGIGLVALVALIFDLSLGFFQYWKRARSHPTSPEAWTKRG